MPPPAGVADSGEFVFSPPFPPNSGGWVGLQDSVQFAGQPGVLVWGYIPKLTQIAIGKDFRGASVSSGTTQPQTTLLNRHRDARILTLGKEKTRIQLNPAGRGRSGYPANLTEPDLRL